MEKFENVERRKKRVIILNNFIGGIAWGLGATVGVSLIAALLVIVLARIDFSLIPYFGSFVSDITEIVLKNLQK